MGAPSAYTDLSVENSAPSPTQTTAPSPRPPQRSQIEESSTSLANAATKKGEPTLTTTHKINSTSAPPPHPGRPTPLQDLDELFLSLPQTLLTPSSTFQTPPAQILRRPFPSQSSSTNSVPRKPVGPPIPPKTPRAPSARARRAGITPSTPFRARPTPNFAKIHQRLFEQSSKNSVGIIDSVKGKGRRMSLTGVEGDENVKRRCIGRGVGVSGCISGRASVSVGRERPWKGRVTTPKPFTFATERVHERWLKKEEERRREEEKVERERRRFKARPMPNFTKKKVAACCDRNSVSNVSGLRTPRLKNIEEESFTPETPRKPAGTGLTRERVRVFDNMSDSSAAGSNIPDSGVVVTKRNGSKVCSSEMSSGSMEVLTPMSDATPLMVERELVLNTNVQGPAMFKTPKPVRVNSNVKKMFETSPIETPESQSMKHVH